MTRRGKFSWITIAKYAAATSAVLGLIVAIPTASAIILAPVNNWIDGRVDIKFSPLRVEFTGTTSVVRDLQMEAAEGKLSANRDAYVKWEVELRKTKDPVSRELIMKQMQNLEATRGGLEQQLKTLRDIRKGM